MTPNFALSLSFDGIRMLRRVSGGWHLVGEVTLDAPDLGGELKVLRQTALELDPAGLRTKLLIPNDQIKYTAIDSTQTDLDDVHAALDGLTPYSIHDLVIDFDRSGGRTHIAAVARETLQEAEAFAVEHNFAPVCFAAVAPPFTFSGEVFFGPTEVANDILGAETPVARDSAAVVVIGSADLTDPTPVSDPTPVAAEQPGAPLVLEPEAEAKDEDSTAAVEILFATRHRAGEDAAPAAPSATPKTIAAPPAPVAAADPAPEVEPLFTRRKETPDDVRAEPPLTATPAAIETPPPIAPPQAKPVVADPIVRPAPLPDRIDAPAAHQSADGTETMSVFGARDGAKIGGKPKYLGLMLTVALIIFMLIVALFVNTATEDGIAGWFKSEPELIETADVPTPVIQAPADAGEQAVVEEQPAPPVLRQPAGRVLSADEANRIYAATGVYQRAPRFTSVPRETSLAGFQEATEIAPGTRLAALAAPDLDAMFPDTPLTTPANPPAPGVVFPRDLRGFILATPEGTVTPEGTIVIAGVPERVPPLRPGTQVVVPVPETTALAPDGAEGLILIAGRPPIVPPLRPDGIAPDDEASVTPDDAVSIVVETVENTAPLTAVDDADVDTIVNQALAAAQIDQAAQAPSVEEVVAVAERPDALPAPRADTLAIPDDVSAAPDAPVAEATQTVEAVPEAAPENVIIVAGRPDLVPPVRPASIVARAANAPAPIVINPRDVLASNGVALATFQPRLRPAGLQPPAADNIQSDPTLAGFRPALRPAGLAPAEEPQEVVEEPIAPDVTSVIAAITAAAPPSPIVNATAQAIVVSPRPGPRPRNFGQVVARAQAAAQQRQAAPQTTAAAPTTEVSSAPAQPTGPVPGGVARAATVDNAIRLRDINLIGVYGRPSNRRALIRLGNGRYVKVEVGSRLDGGRVTAIGDSALNYVKGGRTYALQLPAG